MTKVDPRALPPLRDVKGNISCASLFNAAQSYWHAVNVLVADDPDEASNGPASIAIYALIGFSVELSLKAHLLDRGMAANRLDRKIGHDLRKALAELAERDFVPRTGIAFLVEGAADLHQHHGMRYLPDVPNLKTYDLKAGVRLLQEFMLESMAVLYQRGRLNWKRDEMPPSLQYLVDNY